MQPQATIKTQELITCYKFIITISKKHMGRRDSTERQILKRFVLSNLGQRIANLEDRLKVIELDRKMKLIEKGRCL